MIALMIIVSVFSAYVGYKVGVKVALFTTVEDIKRKLLG
jgi:hypothetical protein